MTDEPRIYQLDPQDVTLDPNNANLGTERGDWQLDESLDRFGAGRSVLLDRENIGIAGNKTLQKAVERGIPITVIETEGETLIAVKRKDLSMKDDPRARALAVADNRVAELNLRWDAEVLVMRVDEGADLSWMFTPMEMEDLKMQVNVPTLDDLAAQYGEDRSTDPDATWPIIKLKVPSAVKQAYDLRADAFPTWRARDRVQALLEALNEHGDEGVEVSTDDDA